MLSLSLYQFKRSMELTKKKKKMWTQNVSPEEDVKTRYKAGFEHNI